MYQGFLGLSVWRKIARNKGEIKQKTIKCGTRQKREKPRKHSVFKAFYGGEEGIRTLVGLPPNGFQDRLVMTASIPLRIWNCLSTEIIRYSIVLEILLEMRFCVVLEVPKKSGVARLFKVFATAVLANFQAHFVPVTPHFNNKKHLKVERCRKNQHQYHTIGMWVCQVFCNLYTKNLR